MDNQVSWMLWTGIAVLAASAAVLVAILFSVRRRHRGEAARTRAILETAVDSIISIDRRGIVLGANPATARMFGYGLEEMLGRNISMLMPERYASRHDGYLAHYRETGERHVIGVGREVEGRRKDGSTFPMELSVGEAMVDGRAVFTGIVRDISARKKAEAELRTAKEQAERATLSQSRFLAAASHDLRQPVQALGLFASALAAKLKGAPAMALLDDMKGSVDALTMLLDAMLDVSRLDAGIVSPHVTAFALDTLTERLAADFRPLAEQKDLDLRLIPCSAVVRSDPTLLYRVLQNLLANAVRFTSQGKILLGCRRHGKKLRISVLDTGIGIPAHLQAEIFKEFFQIGNPERDRTKGLGLGLAIVQRLSQLLHAPISLRSEPDRGSGFTIEVPLVGFNHTTNVVSLRPAAIEPLAPGNGLIFIIDDEPTVLKGLRLAIEDWGYTVLTARTELETMNILTKSRQAPDLVIADYRLRSICNGAQVVTEIRQLFGRSIPGILITGDTAPERIRDAHAYGLKLMHKPITAADLHIAILDFLAPAPGVAGEAAG